jgi:hypothetical protein
MKAVAEPPGSSSQAARDVWFVVGPPVFLRTEEGWSFWQAGVFLGVWVIGYGIVQAFAPALVRRRRRGGEPTGRTATALAFTLAVFPAMIALALRSSVDPSTIVVVGLTLTGSHSRDVRVMLRPTAPARSVWRSVFSGARARRPRIPSMLMLSWWRSSTSVSTSRRSRRPSSRNPSHAAVSSSVHSTALSPIR